MEWREVMLLPHGHRYLLEPCSIWTHIWHCCSVAEVFRDKKILFDYLDMERVDSAHNQTGTSEDLVEGNKTMLAEHVLVKNSSVILTCADQARVRTLALAAQRLGMLDTGQYVLFNLDLFGMDDIENYSPWRDEKVRAGGEVKQSWVLMFNVPGE